MNLLLYGTSMSLLGPAFITYGRRRGENDENEGRWLSYGYPMAFYGPFLLLAYIFSLPTAFLLALAASGALWTTDRIATRRRGRPITSGAWRFGSQSFTVVLAICVLRFFLVEPFHVPSSSMRPTLTVGDYIAVDKLWYGLRMPGSNRVRVRWHYPRAGEVIVFRYPVDESKTFVKRVVGVPGDTIELDGNRLSINGAPIRQQAEGSAAYPSDDDGASTSIPVQRRLEVLGGRSHETYYRSDVPWLIQAAYDALHPNDGCVAKAGKMTCIVPAGRYFVMGDNRNDSLDSRYWGFVSDDLILGRVDLVAVNLTDLGRSGSLVH